MTEQEALEIGGRSGVHRVAQQPARVCAPDAQAGVLQDVLQARVATLEVPRERGLRGVDVADRGQDALVVDVASATVQRHSERPRTLVSSAPPFFSILPSTQRGQCQHVHGNDPLVHERSQLVAHALVRVEDAVRARRGKLPDVLGRCRRDGGQPPRDGRPLARVREALDEAPVALHGDREGGEDVHVQRLARCLGGGLQQAHRGQHPVDVRAVPEPEVLPGAGLRGHGRHGERGAHVVALPGRRAAAEGERHEVGVGRELDHRGGARELERAGSQALRGSIVRVEVAEDRGLDRQVAPNPLGPAGVWEPLLVRALHHAPADGGHLLADEGTGAAIRADNHAVQVARLLEPLPMTEQEALEIGGRSGVHRVAQQPARVCAPDAQAGVLQDVLQARVATLEVPRERGLRGVDVADRGQDALVVDVASATVQRHSERPRTLVSSAPPFFSILPSTQRGQCQHVHGNDPLVHERSQLVAHALVRVEDAVRARRGKLPDVLGRCRRDGGQPPRDGRPLARVREALDEAPVALHGDREGGEDVHVQRLARCLGGGLQQAHRGQHPVDVRAVPEPEVLPGAGLRGHGRHGERGAHVVALPGRRAAAEGERHEVGVGRELDHRGGARELERAGSQALRGSIVRVEVAEDRGLDAGVLRLEGAATAARGAFLARMARVLVQIARGRGCLCFVLASGLAVHSAFRHLHLASDQGSSEATGRGSRGSSAAP